MTIGIDIGGTHVRVGIMEGDTLRHFRHAPIGPHRNPRDLAMYCRTLLDGQTAATLGVGLPGLVQENTLLQAPHYPEWQSVPFAEIFAEVFSAKVAIDNDANMILWGEHQQGAARNVTHAMMITLGTGIGGALLINGEIYRGESGLAGEVGHMTIEMNGDDCPCGNHGCWERYASTQAFAKDPKIIADQAHQGDPTAMAQWQKFGRALATGIASLANITGISHFVIGGGLAGAWDLFSPRLFSEIPRRIYAQVAPRIRIQSWQLGDTAGVIGAALTAQRRFL